MKPAVPLAFALLSSHYVIPGTVPKADRIRAFMESRTAIN